MKIAGVRDKVRETGYFIPVRIHFLLLVIALLLAYKWLKKNNTLPETAEAAIINLFVTITCWFTLGILIISFLSAIIPYILFLFSKKNNRSILKIKTTATEDTSSKQLVDICISSIVKPIFGYLRLRLRYDENNVSPKFTPVKPLRGNHFFSTELKGICNWPLNNIKEYDIKSAVIYFEDFFQFFSFTSQMNTHGNFFTYPLKANAGQVIVQPKKTEDTTERIEELRKVEGELLNYKNFEDNDDVRRIVWKIYAKNKELVVRVPETNDPYASHIYFYASFYDAISNDVYREFNEIFLDAFKTAAWNAYEQLYRQNELTQYIPDQQTKTFYADDVTQKTKYIISTSQWQKQTNIDAYFDKQYGSVLCVSSLSDVNQLADIVEKSGKSLTVIMIQLGNSFSNMKVTDWLQWIFINPGKKGSEKLQLAFTLSPLRKKILDNEKSIRLLLQKSDCESLIINAENL